ncbi:MAG: hypothetical protein M2R45_03048 [Verrucomicrobia subdivision 3 bacterium]|nr:hypothetical protein [Limisphaerales bacterium]MCS1415569.1 hypothetical protein [Limisphaerales bacterium]
MDSHQYELQFSEVLRAVGLPLVAALLVGGLVRLGVAAGMFPPPRPMLDVDRTVIIRQADASREETPMAALLLGDSSCLMDVDTPLLAERMGGEVLNLGTLSYLNLEAFSTLLKNHLAATETPPHKVVMLVHPDFVWKDSSSPAHLAALDHYLSGNDHFYGVDKALNLRKVLGVHLVEGRLIGRLPRPLYGRFGEKYGFTTDMYRYMENHNGSVLDPRILKPDDLKGSSDYRVAAAHERGVFVFANAVPTTTALYIGLTPLPESFPKGDFSRTYQKVLAELVKKFLGAIPLSGLPPTLPDDQFATKTHLKPEARGAFTERLYEQLILDDKVDRGKGPLGL